MMEGFNKDESKLQIALSSYNLILNHNAKPNVMKIAREHEVPYRRLLARIHGRGGYETRKSSRRRLDDAQEEVLLEYITMFDDLHASLDAPRIQAAAEDILRCSHIEDNIIPRPLGKMWAYDFLKRHEEFFKSRRHLKELDRGISENPGDIRWWFGCYTNVIEAYGIQPQDIYNMDETGFRIGQGRRIDAVYTRYPGNAPSIDSASKRQLVTSVECISQDGWVLPPLLILPGEVQLRDWYELVDLPDGYILDHSTSGYINSELAYEWINHFNIATVSRRAGQWRLLIFDQHKSHMTVEFVLHAQSMKILLLPLLPHLTHLLQPLDSIPFMQAKKCHADAVNRVSWLSGYNYDKVHFLSDIDYIRRSAFTSKVIAAGWRETGLYPLDITRIMKRIGAFEDSERPLVMLDGDNVIDTPADVTISTVSAIQTQTQAVEAVAAAPLPSSESRQLQPPATPRTARSTGRLIKGIKARHLDLSPSIRQAFRSARFQSVALAHKQVQLDYVMDELSKKRYQKRTKKQIKTRSVGLLYFKDVKATCDPNRVAEIDKVYGNLEDIQRYMSYIHDPDMDNLSPDSSPLRQAEQLEDIPDEALFTLDSAGTRIK
jgi:hypothetical protein